MPLSRSARKSEALASAAQPTSVDAHLLPRPTRGWPRTARAVRATRRKRLLRAASVRTGEVRCAFYQTLHNTLTLHTTQFTNQTTTRRRLCAEQRRGGRERRSGGATHRRPTVVLQRSGGHRRVLAGGRPGPALRRLRAAGMHTIAYRLDYYLQTCFFFDTPCTPVR